MSAGAEAGDFAEVAYFILKNRCSENGSMTASEVDSYLTDIAQNYAAKNHGIIFVNLV